SPGPGQRFPTGTLRSLRNTDRGEVCIMLLCICIAEQYKAAGFPSKTACST
ncbi:unnamed protein product, partial [Staurois parvus]